MKMFLNRVEKNSGNILYNLTSEEVSSIKEALTFKNPKYEQVKRFSKWAKTRVPAFISYFSRVQISDGTTALRVPYGFDYSKYVKRNLVSYSSYPFNKVIFPDFKLELRDTQKSASKAFLKKNHGIIVLPTGKGKSILGMYIASCLKARTLVLVHKNDLVEGWRKDAKLCFGDDFKVGLIKSKVRDIRELTVATVQTLSRMTEEELTSYLDMFDLVIQDECHRSPAPTFSLVDRFNARHKLGLTATLERSDGLAHMIPLYFGEVVYRYVSEENDTDILPVKVIPRFIKEEYNPPFEVKYVPAVYDSLGNLVQTPYASLTLLEKPSNTSVLLADVDASKKKMFTNFTRHDLDNISVTSKETVNKVIADLRNETSLGHSCVVFFSQIKNLKFYEEVIKQCIPESKVATYCGANSEEENKKSLEEAENRTANITLTTYSKASEGTNCRSWECAFLVSSISDGKNVEQSVGRIRRIKEGKMPEARLYDYVYNNFIILCNNYGKRLARYNRLKFKISGRECQKSPFSLGFKSAGRI